MAGRGSRGRGRRLPFGLVAVAVCALAIYYGRAWWSSPGLPDGAPNSLTGTRAPEQSDSAGPSYAGPTLRPIIPSTPLVATTAPEQAAAVKIAEPPGPDTIRRPVPPSTQPGTLAGDKPVDAQAELEAGFAAKTSDKPLEARMRLNRALHAGVKPTEEKHVRAALAELADLTIFSKNTLKEDPLTERYTVLPGDTMGKIAKKMMISEDLLAEINSIADKHFIREGMRLKVVHGPFHVTIAKREHIMHVYLQDLYVRTCRVALGTEGSTPAGKWKVANHQENPGWTDPRTGKRWHPDEPGNPIGEYWIGLEGIEGEAKGQFGYGIHGTIEPETIGQDVSLGCVRLAPEDIAKLYKLLVPEHSLATISD